MSALALPISELSPVVFDAKAATEYVLSRSKSAVADAGMVFQIAGKTFSLRQKFFRLASKQSQLICNLVNRDFAQCSFEEMSTIAVSLDDLVCHERELLAQAYTLGAEIRIWWGSSLATLATQVEHLDSIAESLHIECDDEASSLVAFAVDEFAHISAKASERFAMQ